ncbi:MAG: iron ABC transporter permease, partial [Synergistaceae bacterium]|nr:iron ABC transporter permease [Synergistaceae bacterium]
MNIQAPKKRNSAARFSFLERFMERFPGCSIKRFGVGFLLCGLVAFFYLVPLLRMFFLSFRGSGDFAFTLSVYGEVLASKGVRTGIVNTLGIAVFSTLLAMTIGLLEAWLIAYTDIRKKMALEIFFMMPFMIPSYITSLAWSRMTGAGGLLSRISGWPWPSVHSYWGIVWVMAICHAPLGYMLCLNALRKIPRDLEWAARCSGASRSTTFARVTLPLVWPGLLGGGAIVVLAGLDNFGIPAFLGSDKGINVLSTLIYQEIAGFGPSSFSRASCLSSILGGLALFCCGAIWLCGRRGHITESVAEDRLPRCPLGSLRLPVEAFVWFFILLTSLLPLFSMLCTSLLKAYGVKLAAANMTLGNYAFLLRNRKALSALRNSFLLAFSTGAVTCLVGSAAAYGRVRFGGWKFRFVEAAFSLPFVLPGGVFALAMILSWVEPLPGWRPGIYGTLWLVGGAYVIRFTLLHFRAAVSAMQQVDVSVEEAAGVCGAGLLVKWGRILTPLLASGLIYGFFMTTTHAFTELTVSSILGALGSETIGAVVLNFEQAGNITVSCAFSIMVLVA